MFASLLPLLLLAAGEIHEVSYPASQGEGELQFSVTYRVWIPEGAVKIRAVIVHQHGCGAGACKGGETAADDLHWQALARKWDAALLGPSYGQEDGQNCRLWCDPRNGSEQAFLHSLRDLAEKTGRPELATAPWCLWGHSGGAFWASIMQAQHPERIVAVWFRSGTAFAAWNKGEIEKPELPAAVFGIPAMLNPGAKEKDDKRFGSLYRACEEMFAEYRRQGAPIGFAADPNTGHECGDSRYLAIPYFDACLALRLPDRKSTETTLRPIALERGWLADATGEMVAPFDKFTGEQAAASWLPNERIARAWREYVESGEVADSSLPPAPSAVKAERQADGAIAIGWEAEADLESGLQSFIIIRDGEKLAQLPEKPQGKGGRAVFQGRSFHDTPEPPLAAMRYVDPTAKPGKEHTYRIVAVNTAGLLSEPSPPAIAK